MVSYRVATMHAGPTNRTALRSRLRAQLLTCFVSIGLATATGAAQPARLPVKAAPAAEKEIWILDQTYVDRGRAKLFISRDAVKIVSTDWGYTLIAAAPDWTVYCFRPEDKIEWHGKLDAFDGRMLFDPVATGEVNEMQITAVGRAQQNGLKCIRFAPFRWSMTAFYEAEEINVSRKASEFINRFYDFPITDKVPILCRIDRGVGKTAPDGKGLWYKIELGKDLRNGVTTELTTNSCQKAPYKASDFSRPQGYKHVSDLTQVAYSPRQKGAISEVMDQLGFASERGTTKKKSSNPTAAGGGSSSK